MCCYERLFYYGPGSQYLVRLEARPPTDQKLRLSAHRQGWTTQLRRIRTSPWSLTYINTGRPIPARPSYQRTNHGLPARRTAWAFSTRVSWFLVLLSYGRVVDHPRDHPQVMDSNGTSKAAPTQPGPRGVGLVIW